MIQLAATSIAFLKTSAIPKTPLITASSTALNQITPGGDNSDERNSSPLDKILNMNPKAKSCVSMAAAMALHFGGYEFARSGALALFTSSETGFSHPSAYPLAMGLVTPFSLGLLYCYGLVLKSKGPRSALRLTKLISIVILTACITALRAAETMASVPVIVSKCLVGILFIFQNSYAHLLYSQQWSFLGSVMTPSEGTKWFSAIAGLSSLVCTLTATMVHRLAPVIGIHGLILGTAGGLTLSLLLADYAYATSEEFGFDPKKDMVKAKKKKPDGTTAAAEEEQSLLSKTSKLFHRVPTLAYLFGEVISFQSLSTVLQICFVRQLKQQIPGDTARAAFSGRFYAYINGISATMQFFVLPMARKYMEPKWVYRFMPTILLPWLIYASLQTNNLWVAAAAFFNLKTLDYALRNVVNEMVFQPLDFESRYLGKEVIGVFANRFGKSGMSLILSLVTAQFSGVGVPELSKLSVIVATMWASCSFRLSNTVVSNKEAEEKVKKRQNKKKD
ncbi:unnamed protein product [Cylindrotheca closterium]|uniref:ADP,ATP carrier protein n=1 Tax=Cylindrotheca closterium TaxID=2856 RepID=A0AAD2FQT9_9STRA|nr:unnamed protein product [Cylindrotheca closterium]